MEFSDLSTFSAVVRCGGITRAASELCTVPSNVTNRIKALEAELGVSLFERHSRGMTLTGAGRRLLPYVERLTVLSREAVAATRDNGVPKGPLAIGSMETTAAVRLPLLLAHFHRTCPAVQLTLRTGPTAVLVDGVLDGSFDGAFVCGPIDHPGLTVISAFREELVLVTAQRWTSLAVLRNGTPAAGPTGTRIPHWLLLQAATRTGVGGVRLALRRPARIRHPRWDPWLRGCRHGNYTPAARRNRASRCQRKHSCACTEGVSRKGRNPLRSTPRDARR